MTRLLARASLSRIASTLSAAAMLALLSLATLSTPAVAAGTDWTKVVVTAGEFEIAPPDFMNSHGIPQVPLTIRNGTSLDFSSMTVKAKLYLNNSKTPTATADILVPFTNGLRPGQEMSGVANIDTFFSQAWVSLAVKNASTRRLEVSLVAAKDFENKPYRISR